MANEADPGEIAPVDAVLSWSALLALVCWSLTCEYYMYVEYIWYICQEDIFSY